MTVTKVCIQHLCLRMHLSDKGVLERLYGGGGLFKMCQKYYDGA